MSVGWPENNQGYTGLVAWHAGDTPWTFPFGSVPQTLAAFSVYGTPISSSAHPCGSALAAQAAALAESLVTASYGYGGKGYDFKAKAYVDDFSILKGYDYYVSDCQTGNLLGLLNAPGVDCSGLVMWSYNSAFGATTDFDDDTNPIQYQTANGQYLNNTTDVSQASLSPGDLLFFNHEHGTDPTTKLPKMADHVAMYVGGDNVVEAYTCDPKYPLGNYVILSSLSTRSKSDPITGQELPVCTSGLKVACFVGFRRVTTPAVKLGIYPASPITLAVTDPDGFRIDAGTLTFTQREVLREVADTLYYGDNDSVISPVLKTGDYIIEVFPKPGANSTEVYSLVAKTAGTAFTLADRVQIGEIPSLGYGIESTGSTITPFIPVAIDIKPGSSTNPINPGTNGTIPVAILSSPTFDALSQISLNSLTFGRTGTESSLGFCNSAGEDVNGDGIPDLVCHFYTQKSDFKAGETLGVLKGFTVGGELIRGTDAVLIVP